MQQLQEMDIDCGLIIYDQANEVIDDVARGRMGNYFSLQKMR